MAPLGVTGACVAMLLLATSAIAGEVQLSAYAAPSSAATPSAAARTCGSAGLGMTWHLFERVGLGGDLRYLVALEEPGRLAGFDREFGRFRVFRASAGVFVRLGPGA